MAFLAPAVDTAMVVDAVVCGDKGGIATPSRALARADSLGGRLRAALIRANACRFEARYSVSAHALGEGAFGRVHVCIDNLVQTRRAVKRISWPDNEQQRIALRDEVEALVMLDHPHIVRLIEYFVEGSELLLVMELLEGPTLRERMVLEVKFTEELAARCARHMLKALFCCHCQGIAHKDVRDDNFKFLTTQPDAPLKMVDFGLSKRCFALARPELNDHEMFAQERDIWGAGAILFEMLSGTQLFPQFAPAASPGSQEWATMVCATDPAHVPSRLSSLTCSQEARELLEGMLEPTNAHRIAAQEALMHPFIIRTYPRNTRAGNGQCFTLQRCVEALRCFHTAVRMKRLALLIVAHLLTSNDETIEEINWLFRFLIRDGHRVEQDTFRTRMVEAQLEVPSDLGDIFKSADICGKGGLDYVEFVAAAMIHEPKIYCRDVMLRAVFRFLDAEDAGMITDGIMRRLFELSLSGDDSIVQEACGSKVMTFQSFKHMMVPSGFVEPALSPTPAPWADMPDVLVGTSESNPTGKTIGRSVRAKTSQRFNPVKSSASESFAVCQQPGFHKSAMRPFYVQQPVSNVIIGIVRGTSRYAREAASLGLAEIIEVGGDANGAFFFMPNPKYHWAPSDAVTNPDVSRLRFVAWWIHPDFLDSLRTWFQQCSGSVGCPGAPEPSLLEASLCLPDAFQRAVSPGHPEIGAPGDFGFSEVQKPHSGYLHTYRDLVGAVHVDMLDALVAGVGRFLERILGSALPSARLSAGFHYPVRPQYSTLHLQLRVNSGEVCKGKEGRGTDLFQLISQLRADTDAFNRDEDTLHYKAAVNLRATVLAAAAFAGRYVQEVGPQALILSSGSAVAC